MMRNPLRTLVAVVLGTTSGMILYHFIENLPLLWPMHAVPLATPWLVIKIALYGFGYGMCALSAVLIWQFMNKHRPEDHETRCRKCRYILRGITEPRCPECGERI